MTRRTGVPSRPAARTALIAMLTMALLLAAAAGLRHRILHAWPDAARDAAPAHTCLAYDAATLAERLPAVASALAPATPLVRPQPCAMALPLGRRIAIARLPRGPPKPALP
ncbi:hypothetical protein [Duganella sp. CF458]|uniref:hypothetical protein n=1 Tax=Duganella sp. CF458 TaxID=1884368 RepID=UPI000B898054|nr:hypothetical protein [Duganella sp. CF458]